MKAPLEPQIDELYKLPLDEFTKARNTLAKALSGSDKKEVTSLVKPSVAMWLVNQLYWQDPATYKALVDASEKLRAAHRAALAGRDADTQRPDQLHRATLEKALAKAGAIAQKRGAPLSDAARDAVRRTLAVLPTDEAPGRLTREPPPVGFSLLTGIKPRVVSAKTHKDAPQTVPSGPTPEQLRLLKIAEKRQKTAEAKARKDEEKARRQREKREREIQRAEQALREAERRLAELKG